MGGMQSWMSTRHRRCSSAALLPHLADGEGQGAEQHEDQLVDGLWVPQRRTTFYLYTHPGLRTRIMSALDRQVLM